jgi:hypothetical protein
MPITNEQLKGFIQNAADAYGGMAEQALGHVHDDPMHGNGWRGEYGNMMMSIVAGTADAINRASTVTTLLIDRSNFSHNHGLGRMPIVQVYNDRGRIVTGSLVRVTEQDIIITGTIGGTVVYI